MTDRNTIKKKYFIMANVIGMLLAMLLYRWGLFYHAFGLFADQSKLMLWAVAVVLTALGICLTYKRRRNGISIAVNVLLPFEIYAGISYYFCFSKRILFAVILAAALALTYSALVLFSGGNRSGKTMVMTRLRHSFLGSRTIVAVCLGGLLLSILFSVVTNDKRFTSETADYEPNDTVSKWLEDSQAAAIKLLKEDVWKGVDIQEKLNTLGVIVNIEAKSLAINHEVHLESGILSDDTIAEYRPSEHVIVVDCGYMGAADSSLCIESVCHEIYHTYQIQQVELYSVIPDKYKDMPMFNQIKEYAEEFDNYRNGDEDFEGYYEQEVEEQARIYSKDCVKKYLYLTDLYNRNGT